MEEFEANSEIAAVTLAKRFRGWSAALASGGFDPSKGADIVHRFGPDR
jgi:hypothetical protein